MVKKIQNFINNLIKIGQTAEENDQIISESSQEDYWFHLSNLPSCHVIISCNKTNPLTKEMIIYCARLVKENTKYKNYSKLKVNYCQIKNVKKTDVKGKVNIKGKINTILI